MNSPVFNVLSDKEKTQLEIRDLIDSQLKTAQVQSKTSKKQYITSLLLTIAAIIISLAPLGKEIIIDKPNYSDSIIKLTETQLLIIEKVSETSNYIIGLQNKIQKLEKENKLLKEKLKI